MIHYHLINYLEVLGILDVLAFSRPFFVRFSSGGVRLTLTIPTEPGPPTFVHQTNMMDCGPLPDTRVK